MTDKQPWATKTQGLCSPFSSPHKSGDLLIVSPIVVGFHEHQITTGFSLEFAEKITKLTEQKMPPILLPSSTSVF